MSLYRKYRPVNFADVSGQEHIVQTLEQAASQDKLVHAYLFSGARGTGKTSVARILAKVMLTRSIADENIRSQIMKAADDGSLVDLIEIDAASNRGIDDIRTLIEKIQFSPVVATAKVYIIDEAHMLTKEAFNALLKTLEEPPSYAYFILATTELQKVPQTIQSRCQRFAFRSIRDEDIVRRLQYITDQERIPVDRQALRAIAMHAQGGMRDAISLLDQLRSLPQITLAEVRERIGESGQEHLHAVMDAVSSGDSKALVNLIRTMEESGIALDMFLRQLLTHVRGELHRAIEEKQPHAAYTRILDVILEALKDMRSSPVPGLVVECALLSLTRLEGERSAALPRLTHTAAGVHEPQPRKEKEEIHENQPPKEVPPSAIVEAPALTLESLRDAWAELVRHMSPAAAKMSLQSGRVRDVTDRTVTISFSSSFHRDRITAAQARRNLEKLLQEKFRQDLKIECVTEEAGSAALEADRTLVSIADAATEIFSK
jgi:DNA polymerase-3 subunit gamma/tau